MEILSLIVSVTALLGSAVTYLMHERRLKAQEAKINVYQLRKFEEEEREAKKAIIRANMIKGERGKRTIKVYNKGKATARNVRFFVEGAEGDDLFIGNNPFPMSFMNEHDAVDLVIHLHSGSPDQVIIRLEWEDDFFINNEHSQIIVF